MPEQITALLKDKCLNKKFLVASIMVKQQIVWTQLLISSTGGISITTYVLGVLFSNIASYKTTNYDP